MASICTKARHTLEPNYWAKILLVRFEEHPAGAYCIWETEGTIYGYDRNSGGFPIPIYTRDPYAIAVVLARELSNYMNEPLTVKSADFIEPGSATLYAFDGDHAGVRRSALLGTAPFPPRYRSPFDAAAGGKMNSAPAPLGNEP